MEKITSISWRPDQSVKDEMIIDHYYDGNSKEVIIEKTIANGKTWEDNRLKAQDVLNSYASKGYDKLQKHSQYIHDFLIGRGFKYGL